MIVARIQLKNFRNHRETLLELGPQMNVMLGKNGEGKTSILEAISYLSLTKSFYAPNDATVTMIGEDGFTVDGVIISDAGLSHAVRVRYDRDSSSKDFTINSVHPETLGSVIGRFPIVVLSPENNAITFGGPADRRRFLDLVLSQISSVYFGDLVELRRVLRQRNRILTDARFMGSRPGDLLAPWTDGLIRHGSRIIHRRLLFAREFTEYVLRAYASLVTANERPDIVYCTGIELADDDDEKSIAAKLAIRINHRESEEYRRGASLVGPHRDDLQFMINDGGVRRYASQGQHKTLLVALKIAEFHYLRERRGEQPIFLLDDVFSELDESRRARILETVDGLGQTFITTTDEQQMQKPGGWQNGVKRFMIEHGTCTRTW
jgi:DNA replication and repair protein RecF